MSLKITQEHEHINTKAIIQSTIARSRQEEFTSMKHRLKMFHDNEKLVELLPALPELPIGSSVGASIGDIWFNIPRSQAMINTIKSLDWKGYGFILRFEEDNSAEDGSYHLVYYHESQSWNFIRFSFEATLEGSACVLTKIGEKSETRVIPIYEVTCPEGAKENVWNQ